MKTSSTFLSLIGALAIAPLAFTASPQRGPAGYGANQGADCPNGPMTCIGTGGGNASCPGVCTNTNADATPLTLSPAARSALRFQIDEERMARELYTAFSAKWGLQPFANIPQAEVRHETALRQLARRAGVAAPTAIAASFDTTEVQLRYNALLALGLESADSALRAAAFVEEQDIADLNTLIAATDDAALRVVATALKLASGHHLRAFVGVLAARGVTYAPKVMSADEYQAILGNDHRGMGRRQGFGRM